MELCVLTRHAESQYNVAGLVNGDPSRRIGLSARGRAQARALSTSLAGFEIGACVHSRFGRTAETARLALGAAAARVPFVCEPRLDDIGCGEMEGLPVADDHGWRASRPRDRAPAGGESITGAALRIADGLRSVASRREPVVMVVSHELIVRYTVNASGGSADIALPLVVAPQAELFLLDRAALEHAAERIFESATGAWGTASPRPDTNGG